MAAVTAAIGLCLLAQVASQAPRGTADAPVLVPPEVAAQAALCLDNGLFTDEKGNSCRHWATWGCSADVFSSRGYSNAGAAAVLAFCKYSCGRCGGGSGGRPPRSPPSTPPRGPSGQCLDDGDWKDEKGYTCSSWAFWGCSAESFSSWGYSRAGAQAILTNCPHSCGQCGSSKEVAANASLANVNPAEDHTAAEPEAVVTSGLCMDNGLFTDEKGNQCRNWASWGCSADVFSSLGYSNAGAAAVLAFCKYSCGRCGGGSGGRPPRSPPSTPPRGPSGQCLDDGDWKDEKGYTCSSWAFWGCSAESFSSWGYSRAGAEAILANCPHSCGQCGSSKEAGPLPTEPSVLLP